MDTLTFILFIVGLIALIAGAELLVRGASQLAVAVGISPLVVGMTVVAFGTSAPELAVTIQSGLSGAAEIAIGNVVGSNIANILLILGLSALIVPLSVAQKLVRIDVPIMIGVSLLVLALSLDGRIERLGGSLLFAGIVAYTVFAIRQSRRESSAVQAEYAHEFGDVEALGVTRVVSRLALMIGGLALLVLGSRWLVNGAVAVARVFGLSELIIGLTVMAVGTSLPEIATSIIAALRGERDIAVGNVIGSNLFNMLSVLGLTAMVMPNGVPVPQAALRFDIPFMIAVSVACLPIFFTGYRIARWEGALFLAYYAAYLLYLILDATQHASLPALSTALFGFIVPLTAITLLLLVVRGWRAGQHVPKSAGPGSPPTEGG